jgi:hypothetical protein
VVAVEITITLRPMERKALAAAVQVANSASEALPTLEEAAAEVLSEALSTQAVALEEPVSSSYHGVHFYKYRIPRWVLGPVVLS